MLKKLPKFYTTDETGITTDFSLGIIGISFFLPKDYTGIQKVIWGELEIGYILYKKGLMHCDNGKAVVRTLSENDEYKIKGIPESYAYLFGIGDLKPLSSYYWEGQQLTVDRFLKKALKEGTITEEDAILLKL